LDQGLVGDDQVTDVRRVERAAQDADVHRQGGGL
jgi:hypothetical protein